MAVHVRDLARSYTSDAIKTLVAVMKNPKAPSAARVSAASVLLDRGYGKAAQEINANIRRDIHGYTDEELIILAGGEGGEEGTQETEGGEEEPHPVH